MSAAIRLRSSSESREGERQVAERAFLPVETRSDEPPGEAPKSHDSGLERQGGRRRLSGPESEIFQPMAQGFREGHRSASNRRPGRGG